MKNILIFIILMTIQNFCSAQLPRQLNKEDSIQIENEITQTKEKLKQTLNNKAKNTYYLTDLNIQFRIDTFEIEQRERLKLEIDYTTNGMVISALDAMREYDKLLNKYYQKLLNRLGKTDKEILRQTQRNWIEFRNSELELNKILMEDNYSGGGTIQRVFAASKVLNLTKNRVMELYHYLTRIME